MPFPLAAVLIGAGIGAMAGGMSGEDGWDWNRALMGGVFGGATGGIGAAAMAPAAAVGAGSAAAVPVAGSAAASGGGWMAAGGAGTAATFGAPAAAAAPAGLSGLNSYGMGSQALANSGAQTAGVAGVTNTPLMHSYANPNVGNQFTKAGSDFMTKQTAGKPFDYGQLGESIQSFGDIAGEAEQKEPFEPLPLPRENPMSQQEQTIARDLEESRQSIYGSVPGGTSSGLGGIATAAKGGIATRFGMMKTPSGSLTGGEIVGPGTATSDTIRSGIYPDIASKLGASSSNIGQGHNVQQAALSDGEYVITAAAVENLGQGAGAPAGQEREFGSKLLDRAMNEWQRA